MASYKLYRDSKAEDESGLAPVRITLSNNHTNTRIDTGVKCFAYQWVGNGMRPLVDCTKEGKADNDRIEQICRDYENAIYELTRSGRILTMRPADIRAYVYNNCATYTSKVDFFEMCKRVKVKKNKATAGHIEDAVRWVKRFCGRKTLAFEDITRHWLTEFIYYMANNTETKNKKGLGPSTQGIILRNIRMVYNAAIADGVAHQDSYPFKGFTMPRSPKRKEWLMPEDLRKIRDAELPPKSRIANARDYFMLCFYLCGTNLADLLNIREENGYIVYVRQKVANKVDDEIRMKIQPEAMEIIQRHKGVRGVLDCSDRFIDYESFYPSVRHGLGTLAKMLDIPHLTTYIARYTWATYASHECVPVDIIDKSLGHVTNTVAGRHYIVYDWRHTDKANRRVIDFLASDRTWDDGELVW